MVNGEYRDGTQYEQLHHEQQPLDGPKFNVIVSHGRFYHFTSKPVVRDDTPTERRRRRDWYEDDAYTSRTRGNGGTESEDERSYYFLRYGLAALRRPVPGLSKWATSADLSRSAWREYACSGSTPGPVSANTNGTSTVGTTAGDACVAPKKP